MLEELLKVGIEAAKMTAKAAEKGIEGIKDISGAAKDIKKLRPETKLSQPFSLKIKDVYIPRAVRPEKNLTQPKNMLGDLKTSYKERIDRTPLGGQRGEWTGLRGESKFVPNNLTEAGKTVSKKLAEFNMDGVNYKNGLPDFSKFSKESVKIDMTEYRYSNIQKGIVGNFEKADLKCAENWNKCKKDGRTDWKPRDVEKFRETNKYTWHECADKTTCQMIPREIHEYFGHSGGVSECKKIVPGGGVIFDA